MGAVIKALRVPVIIDFKALFSKLIVKKVAKKSSRHDQVLRFKNQANLDRLRNTYYL